MKLPEWLDQMPAQQRTKWLEISGLLLLALLAFWSGCEVGKHSTTFTIQPPVTVTTTVRDTVERAVFVRDTAKLRTKGEHVNGKVHFHKDAPSDKGTVTLDATYDPLTDSLFAEIKPVLAVTVPEIIVTHSTTSIIPIKEEEHSTSGWLYIALGSALTIIAFLAIHFFL